MKRIFGYEIKKHLLSTKSLKNNKAMHVKEALEEVRPRVKSIYIVGEYKKEDRLAIAVVGSRKITDYGIRICQHMIPALVRKGFTIISGLMYGVDIEAHKIALDSDGRTIAVLGYGFDCLKHISYARDVAERMLKQKKGAIVTEYDHGLVGNKWTFPRRNRIIAGLSVATLVIEANERSGSLVTANYTMDQGKDVFVVPGSIFSKVSKGKHELIKDGATPVDHPNDILFQLEIDNIARVKSRMMLDTFNNDEQYIIKAIGNELLALDDIFAKVPLVTSKINTALTSLEVKGVIKRNQVGKWYLSHYAN